MTLSTSFDSMKYIDEEFFRNILYNSFAIFLISQLLPGFKVSGGLPTYILGGIALTLLLVFLRPVLNIVALPLNLVTMGLFSFVVNIIIFYILTVLVIGITISSFTFPGYSYAGFIIPKIYVNTLFAFILVSFLQSLIVTSLRWLTKLILRAFGAQDFVLRNFRSLPRLQNNCLKIYNWLCDNFKRIRDYCRSCTYCFNPTSDARKRIVFCIWRNGWIL